MVPHNGFAHHLDADLIQLFGQEERVGVHAVRGKKLRTHCDNFGFHLVHYATSGKPRTSQSSVKIAPVVAKMARPEGCSARPTSPEPLSTTSARACGVIRTMPRRPPYDPATYRFASRSKANPCGRPSPRKKTLTSPPCVMRCTRSKLDVVGPDHIQFRPRASHHAGWRRQRFLPRTRPPAGIGF